MASTFSTNLRLELIATGEQSGTWGDTTNTNLGSLLEQAVGGYQSVTMTDANYTLSALNGLPDESRNMVLKFVGTLSAQRNVSCPDGIEKLYLVNNATTGGFPIVFKTASGTGVTVANGSTAILYADGTNVIAAANITAAGAALLDDADAAAQRTTLGLGTIATQNANNVSITGGSISGLSSLTSTGVVTLPAGTVSAPALTTTGDTNTGVWFPAADTVAVSTGGTERLRIDSSGNIGVGTSSPGYKLDIAGSARISGTPLRITNITSTDIYNAAAGTVIDSFSPSAAIFIQTQSAERMRITSAGDVGIGISAPTDILDINGGIRRRLITAGTSSVPVSEVGLQYQFGTGTANRAGLYFLNSYNNNGAAWLSFWTTDPSNNYAERARVDQLGSLLINRTTSFAASSKIQLNAENAVVDSLFGGQSIMAIASDSYAADLGASVGLGGRNSGGNFVVFGSVSGRSSGAGSQGYLQFATSSGSNLLERMRIDSSGNVGIGTSSPSYRFHAVNTSGTIGAFRGTTAANSSLIVGNTAGDLLISTLASGDSFVYADTSKYLALGSNSTERLRILSNGDIGIGQTAVTGVFGRTVSVTGPGGATLRTTGSTVSAYLYSSDGNGVSGLVSETNHPLVLSTNSVERVRIDTSGNVGIGTTAPATRLHVDAFAGGIGNALTLQNTGATVDGRGPAVLFRSSDTNIARIYSLTSTTTNAGRLVFSTAAAGTLADWMTILSNGNVGVGTTAPASKFTVFSSASTDDDDLITLGFSGFNPMASIGTHNTDGNNGGIKFSTQSAGALGERMRITSGGNVGIGTTNPAQRLDVSGRVRAFTAASALSELQFQALYTGLATPVVMGQGSDGTGYLINLENDPLVFGTNGTERARINASGDLLVNTATPVLSSANRGNITVTGSSSAIISVGTSASAYTLLYHDANGAELWNNQATYLRFATSNTERMRIDSAGNVGIGITPSAWSTAAGPALQVNRAAIFQAGGFDVSTFATNAYFITGSGYYYMGSATATMYQQTNGAHIWFRSSSGTAGNLISFTQSMNLNNSGNLGIGTTNPTFRVHAVATDNVGVFAVTNGSFLLREVGGSSANNTIELNVRPNSGKSGYITFTEDVVADRWAIGIANGNGALRFISGSTAGTERMRIDASGNVGLGVTPESGWASNYTSLSLKNSSGIFGQSGAPSVLALYTNSYINSSFVWTYTASAPASVYQQNSGRHEWYTAPSGTAGNAISFNQAMTLDASGNLGIGTTSPSVRLSVSGRASIANTADVSNIFYVRGVSYGVRIGSSATVANIEAVDNAGGSTSFQPLYVGGSTVTMHTGGSERLNLDANGNVIVNSAAIATTATNGFLYIPSCAGVPTGVPTTYAGRVPLVVDSTNSKLYMYVGGAWVALN